MTDEVLKHLKLNQCTHIARPKPSGAMYISQRAIKKSFGPPFSKGGGFSGRRPEAHSAECEILHRSKNAGEGEFLCEAKEEGEPSSGVLLYLWLACAIKQSGRIISSPTLYLQFVRTLCAVCL